MSPLRGKTVQSRRRTWELFAAVGVAHKLPGNEPILIGLLAGEPSGILAWPDAVSKSQLTPHTVRFVGVGGPLMQAEGLETLADFESLAVNGFRDPLLRLPALRVVQTFGGPFIERRVDAFVGIDFNVFNFILEGRLKRHGIATAHYVSPSVYAWRRGHEKGGALC